MANISLPTNWTYCQYAGLEASELWCFDTSRLGELVSNFNNDLSQAYSITSSGNIIADCQNLKALYGNEDSFLLYNICLALPDLYSYVANDTSLLKNLTEGTNYHFPKTIPREDFSSIADATTNCLISTCINARDPQACTRYCTPSKLLLDPTTPSFADVSDCVYSLCNSIATLPYPSGDILGIGVFISYILQCAICLFLCSAAVTLAFASRRAAHRYQKWILQQQERLITGLVDFQKAQCFFNLAVILASFAINIVRDKTLNVFSLLPIALNTVGSVVYAFLVLNRYGKFSKYIAVLTTINLVLGSALYWTLYAELHGYINSNPTAAKNGDGKEKDTDEYIFQTLAFDISRNNQCGNYSALSICPDYFNQTINTLEFQNVFHYSPLLWTWWVACFMYVILTEFRYSIIFMRRGAQFYRYIDGDQLLVEIRAVHIKKNIQQFWNFIVDQNWFWISVLLGTMALGAQIYLLSIEVTLKMVDTQTWSFGQIVGITAWLPPLIECLHLEINGIVKGSDYRLAQGLTVTRTLSKSFDDSSLSDTDDISLQQGCQITSPVPRRDSQSCLETTCIMPNSQSDLTRDAYHDPQRSQHQDTSLMSDLHGFNDEIVDAEFDLAQITFSP